MFRDFDAMRSFQLLALLLGCLLLAAPLTRVHCAEDAEDDEDEYEEPDEDTGETAKADDVDDSEKDVVILTSKNFDNIVMKAEFALVRRWMFLPLASLLFEGQICGNMDILLLCCCCCNSFVFCLICRSNFTLLGADTAR